MYIVKNIGQYPIIIRDLNLHIAGGKTVDLDELFNPDTVRRSVSLQTLIGRRKLIISDNVEQNKIDTVAIETQNNPKILVELKKDLIEIKDMLRSVSPNHSQSVEQKYDEDTTKRITELQVSNLSKSIDDAKKNFDNIGKSTNKSENLDKLLGVLDSLDNKGE